VEGFRRIVAGELDHIEERHFLYAGTIDDVIDRHNKSTAAH
jgi:F0F1-type ATP synthase beta subunit